MKVLIYPNSDVHEVAGNTLAVLPSGGAAFLEHTCDFCQQTRLCLVIDNTNGEYSPACICVCCIAALRPA